MTPRVQEYLDALVRYHAAPFVEADEMLDRLDDLWYSLTAEEMAEARAIQRAQREAEPKP
jgi:cell division septum initiation protein DivIVA